LQIFDAVERPRLEAEGVRDAQALAADRNKYVASLFPGLSEGAFAELSNMLALDPDVRNAVMSVGVPRARHAVYS
jgi:hypothetical protein